MAKGETEITRQAREAIQRSTLIKLEHENLRHEVTSLGNQLRHVKDGLEERNGVITQLEETNEVFAIAIRLIADLSARAGR